jgi:hypothetical protein
MQGGEAFHKSFFKNVIFVGRRIPPAGRQQGFLREMPGLKWKLAFFLLV